MKDKLLSEKAVLSMMESAQRPVNLAVTSAGAVPQSSDCGTLGKKIGSHHLWRAKTSDKWAAGHSFAVYLAPGTAKSAHISAHLVYHCRLLGRYEW